MNFNIDTVLADMLGAIKGTITNNWGEVKNVADQFLQRKKEKLELIAQLRISGDLTQEKFESRLQDEKLVLEAELNALAVISKAIVQKAANAAIDILVNAVKTAISSVI